MTTINPQDYKKNLEWRYATKAYDTTRKLSEAQLNDLLEVLRLSPSSFGLEPWKFLVVNTPELRQRLRSAAWGQPQVTDASHFIVIAVRKALPMEYINHILENTAQTRNMKLEDLDEYKKMVLGTTTTLSPEDTLAWNKKQAYIALGFLLSAAAQFSIDATPMEGFDASQFDQILGLESQGLTTTVVCAVGFRSIEDKYAHAAKARLPKEELIEVR